MPEGVQREAEVESPQDGHRQTEGQGRIEVGEREDRVELVCQQGEPLSQRDLRHSLTRQVQTYAAVELGCLPRHGERCRSHQQAPVPQPSFFPLGRGGTAWNRRSAKPSLGRM